MSLIFNERNNLKYLDLTNFDMANIVTIEKMFKNIPNLKYINLTNLKN